jgi:hypothetical protein
MAREKTEEREKEKDEAGGEGAAAAPARKADGELTRAGMESVIRGGGAVIYKGIHYGKVDDLPAESEIVEGDARASAAATAALDAQIAALASQRAALEGTHARNVEAERKKAEAAGAGENRPGQPPKK